MTKLYCQNFHALPWFGSSEAKISDSIVSAWLHDMQAKIDDKTPHETPGIPNGSILKVFVFENLLLVIPCFIIGDCRPHTALNAT